MIVTGSHTGVAADPEELKVVKDTVNIPVFIGSGVSAENISKVKVQASELTALSC